MSGGGAHDAEAGGSSSRQKGPTYWELLESQEQQRDPTFVPPVDEEIEGESSDDEMEEADAGQDVKDASTTDGGDGGETTDGGTRRQQNPTKPDRKSVV